MLLAAALTFLSIPCLAQDTVSDEPKPPDVELLTMSGSKPNLSPAGEGITSFKTSDLFGRGVTHVNPFDKPKFPIELPVGYTLFNKLIYQIDSKAVFSGPNDIVFHLPSATTAESFDKLRILYADRDPAEPEKPRWVDATLTPEMFSLLDRYLTKTDFDKRLPDFKTRRLHAFTEFDPAILVVALRDPALARDNFVADLSLTGTAPEQVMVGRHVTYDIQVTNIGPDTATDITFHAQPSFELISATASQGKCRMEASNVYCNFPRLEKGKSISIKIEEKCRWDAYVPESPVGSGAYKQMEVRSAEGEPNFENNSLSLQTDVIEDPNKPPVAEIISPKQDELFSGPDATVTIIARASDPDGFINQIEFFDQGAPIGKGKLIEKDEYQLVYKKVALGRHWLEVKVTDNLGREVQRRWSDFFVNGLAKVEISDPKTGSLLDRPEGELSVSVHATHPTSAIKEVKVYLTAQMAGNNERRAEPVGNDVYVAKIDCSFCKRDAEVIAIVTDGSGVETRSAPVSFKLRKPPVVTLHHYDGEDVNPIPTGQVFDLPSGSSLLAEFEHDLFEDLNIVKVDFFANGKLIDSYVQSGRNDNENRYVECHLEGLAEGRYKIQAIATDSDGSVGRSAVVEIAIKK